MAAERWGEKEICTKEAVDGQKKGEGWGWRSEDYLLALPLTPLSTLTPNQSWPVG